jgi:hypothetical protein
MTEPASKPTVQEETVAQELPVLAKVVEPPVVETIAMSPVTVKKVEAAVGETADQKAERVKREAVARVRARFGMPEKAVEALSAAMAKPMQKQEPAFVPMVAFRAANSGIPKPAVIESAAEKIAAEPVAQAPVEETIFEWQKASVSPVVHEVAVQQAAPSEPVATPLAAQVARPQLAVGPADLPPVRRVTLQQERAQQVTIPVIPWALQPERRRVPREPIVFPRGLNKAAMRMIEKGQTMARGQAGPSLTAAEQAVANKVSSTQHPVAMKPVVNRREESKRQNAAPRWNLLRRFGAFEVEEQREPSLQDRAAG